MTARILEVSDADYYADRLPGVPGPTLSASIAGKLVTESPLVAHHHHPRLGGYRWEGNAATETGNIMHALLLENASGIVVIDHDDYRSKQAREDRDAATAQGLRPVIRAKLAPLMSAAEAIRHRLRDTFGIVLDGRSEVAITWRELTDAGPVDCRGKLDHLRGPTIYDLKTTSGSVAIEPVSRRICESAYDVQAAAYTSAVEQLDPSLRGRVSFVFIFAQLEPPYVVTPVQLSGLFLELGYRRWRRACETWARCLKTNRWPGPVERVETVEAPTWALAKEEYRDETV